MIVSNSSPLINFSKINRLNLLNKCFKEIIIPQAVYNEITFKKELPETNLLISEINNKWIKVTKIDIQPLIKGASIGIGEMEAISLAIKLKSLLLLDDNNAKKIAKLFNIETHGTLFPLLLSYKNKLLSKKELVEIIRELIDNNYYIDNSVLLEFLKKI
jgi:uncharacterized protein